MRGFMQNRLPPCVMQITHTPKRAPTKETASHSNKRKTLNAFDAVDRIYDEQRIEIIS